MNKRIKIKDIAERLGISPSTVSRALNPETANKISKAVVADVKKIAAELGYCLDINAAGLRTQKSHIIGILIPDILNPIFPALIKGAQTHLEANQFVTLIASTNNHVPTAIDEIKKLLSRRVEGLILASAFSEDESVSYCIGQNIPLVLAGRCIDDPDRVHHVISDDDLGIRLAVDHLLALGHTRIVHFAGPANISQGKDRLNYFLRYCRAKNIDYTIIQLDSFTIEAGKQGALTLLASDRKASAIIAANDMIAIGAMRTLQENGVQIPDDYSIIGYNDMFLSDMIHPPLTTIGIPLQELGQQAAKTLLQTIASPEQPKQKHILTPRLLIRKSTSAVR